MYYNGLLGSLIVYAFLPVKLLRMMVVSVYFQLQLNLIRLRLLGLRLRLRLRLRLSLRLRLRCMFDVRIDFNSLNVDENWILGRCIILWHGTLAVALPPS
jgi:hypothetical protein